MPRGDGTGPAGRGRMTGRGMGYCAGYDAPGFMNCRFGFGRGFGRGFAPVQMAPARPVELSKEEQIKVLKEQEGSVRQELKALQDKLKQLKGGK